MSPYRYEKRMPKVINIPIIPMIFIGIGLALLLWVSIPILSFAFNNDTKVVSPLADQVVKPVAALNDLKYASNWFDSNNSRFVTSGVNTYTLSIPKIGIKKAYVKIGSDDLSQSLVQFGNSALPGQLGDAIIFGHSVLPQFYDPNNYMTIFSLLPELIIGDEIYVNYDGMNYRYLVTKKVVADPTDESGLVQDFENSSITLVTCVPPGTYFKRLWVTARLVNYTKPNS